jgi:hypothetical protein
VPHIDKVLRLSILKVTPPVDDNGELVNSLFLILKVVPKLTYYYLDIHLRLFVVHHYLKNVPFLSHIIFYSR